MSHTSSTYTFTTCRILHPSDQLTSVTPSPSFVSRPSNAFHGTPTYTPSSVFISAPPTPSYTPACTPRRLSLSLSLAESSTNQRDSTRTTSTSMGLVRLLQEQGISASVYDPHSWNRGLDSTSLTDRSPTESEERPTKRPNSLLLMQTNTPPNSPHARSKSAYSPDTRPIFQFSPSQEEPPYYDIFLASKPARTILREVLGESEKECGAQAHEDIQIETSNLRLVDKLKRFRTLSPLSASSGNAALLAPFSSTALANGALGGGLTGLSAGLRRNRSYPALVGASMAMKDPGGTDILIQQTTQSVSHDASKCHHSKAKEHFPTEQVTRRKTRPKLVLQNSVDSEDDFGE